VPFAKGTVEDLLGKWVAGKYEISNRILYKFIFRFDYISFFRSPVHPL